MRNRFLVGALTLSLLASGSAQAKDSHRLVYHATLSIAGALALACFGTSVALRVTAPNTDTLMTYKRFDTASGDLAIAGGVLAVATVMFAMVGRLSLDLKKDDVKYPTALWLAPAGAGLALGGTF